MGDQHLPHADAWRVRAWRLRARSWPAVSAELKPLLDAALLAAETSGEAAAAERANAGGIAAGGDCGDGDDAELAAADAAADAAAAKAEAEAEARAEASGVRELDALLKLCSSPHKAALLNQLVCGGSVAKARPACRDGECDKCGMAALWSRGMRPKVIDKDGRFRVNAPAVWKTLLGWERYKSPPKSSSAAPTDEGHQHSAAAAAAASEAASLSASFRGARKAAAASTSARRAASARCSATVAACFDDLTSSRAASSSAARRSLVAWAAEAFIIVPKNVPVRLSFCAATAAAAALLTALSAMHLACFTSISCPSERTHSSSVVLDFVSCRCSENRQPQSRCAMIYSPALAFATLDDVMIGMLAVSASRASFRSSSPAEVMCEMLFRTNTSTVARPVGELAARTFREFCMSESVLMRSLFVPGSR